MYNINSPFSFHIELTDKCNARCVQCSRNFVDDLGNLNEKTNLCLTEITIEQYKNIFKDYLHKTKSISFSGNMGDPLFAKDILEITKYSFSHVLKPNTGILTIYTNGGFRSKKWWHEYGSFLKDKFHEIYFAIDGLEDTHHLYRTNTMYHRVIENARAFIDAGGTAHWSFIRFGHNQHQEKECRNLAKKFGFKKFTAVNTQRFYDREQIDYKWKDEKYSITKYKSDPLKIDEARKNFSLKESAGNIDCKVVKRNEIYIDCMGYVHPCCWIGSHEYQRINENKKSNDFDYILLKNREFEPAWGKSFLNIIEKDWYQHILPESWETSPCMICATQCGKGKYKTVRQHENL
tara:strand:- start:151 stop:1194 length:1044 start_codon:yes stop_codon:yes gene_type:complete